ncbi:MAG: hypothetical protein RLZZ437_478 [Pseudomonadota bacterium]
MRLILCITVMLALQAFPARAEFAVCNQSFDVVNVAIGQFERNEFVTRGWWTVGPNQCANVIKDKLEARYVYVFAQDVFGNAILNGATNMCVGPKRFEIQGEKDCAVRGFIEVPYVEVDTQRTERWTLFLTPQGAGG